MLPDLVKALQLLSKPSRIQSEGQLVDEALVLLASTAVFVANDQMALGLLRYLHEIGRETPKDISIVGFDDIPKAAYFTPPLTTVRDLSELGRRCLHLLLGQIESRQRSCARV